MFFYLLDFNAKKKYQLASGEVFGQDQPIALKLLGSERSFQALEGETLLLSTPYYLRRRNNS
jgi:hypothetical protein